jgi:hypothetical protein
MLLKIFVVEDPSKEGKTKLEEAQQALRPNA